MYICKDVLTKDECKEIVKEIKKANWQEGASKAGKKHKNNQELHLDELSVKLGQKIMEHPTVRDYAFIHKMHKPRFNCYTEGQYYNKHVDLFHQSNIRTDWSMTLFLVEPDAYEGGELIVHDYCSEPEQFKLSAGTMILYPSGAIHSVNKVTKGERIAAISWAQSLIEDPVSRKYIGRLREVMMELEAKGEWDVVIKLSSIFNNFAKKFGQW